MGVTFPNEGPEFRAARNKPDAYEQIDYDYYRSEAPTD